jgi:hypothetical protein
VSSWVARSEALIEMINERVINTHSTPVPVVAQLGCLPFVALYIL